MTSDGDAGSRIGLLHDTESTFFFNRDGTINGDSKGCNIYDSGYEISGDEITLSDIASTEILCFFPEGIMGQNTSLNIFCSGGQAPFFVVHQR